MEHRSLLMFVSDAFETPDPLKAHHQSQADVALGQIGLEFDYRVYWIDRVLSGYVDALLTNPLDPNTTVSDGRTFLTFRAETATDPVLVTVDLTAGLSAAEVKAGVTPAQVEQAIRNANGAVGNPLRVTATSPSIEIKSAGGQVELVGPPGGDSVDARGRIFGDSMFVMVNVVDTAATVPAPTFPAFSLLPLLLPKFQQRTAAQVAIDDRNASVPYLGLDETGTVGDHFDFLSDSKDDRRRSDARWTIRREADGEATATFSSREYKATLVTKPRSRVRYVNLRDTAAVSDGYIVNGVLGRAAYVVQPDLVIDSEKSSLRISGRNYDVTGSAWVDRLWSKGGAGRAGALPQPFAWRWFAIRYAGTVSTPKDLNGKATVIYQMWDPYTGKAIKHYLADIDDGKVVYTTEKFHVEPADKDFHEGRCYHKRWSISRPDEERKFAEVWSKLTLKYSGTGLPWVRSSRLGVTHHYVETPCDVSRDDALGEPEVPNATTAWAQQVNTDWIEIRADGFPGLPDILKHLRVRC
ncbi:hypothetical protein OAX78_01815 [Planctomycetota bacterium]|nr:hypothetical protein [Planctomycetota bacterium]